MENAISRKNTLRSITIWPAKGSFDEKIKGSIEQGKLADFVMLDHDIMRCKEMEIPQVKPVLVFVQGEKVFGNNE